MLPMRLLFVGFSPSQQHTCVYLRDGSAQTCCHTETDVADQTCCLKQSQYTDPGPTSPRADTVTPAPWQGSRCITSFEVTGMTRPGKRSTAKARIEPRSVTLEADSLTTRPTRRKAKKEYKHTRVHTIRDPFPFGSKLVLGRRNLR